MKHLGIAMILRLAMLLSLSWATTTLAADDDSSTSSLYLYRDDPEAKGVVTEYRESSSVTFFEEDTNPRVVEFYSPYCPACRNFKPSFLKMARAMIEEYPEVHFYTVSCSAEKDKCREHNIAAFPTMIFFPRNASEGNKQRGARVHQVSEMVELLELKANESVTDETSSNEHDLLPAPAQTQTEREGKEELPEGQDEPQPKQNLQANNISPQDPALIPPVLPVVRNAEVEEKETRDVSASHNVLDDENDEIDYESQQVTDQESQMVTASEPDDTRWIDTEEEDKYTDSDPRDDFRYFQKKGGAQLVRSIDDPSLNKYKDTFRDKYSKAGKSKTFFRHYTTKEGVYQHERVREDDSTTKMRAYQPGTPEYNERRQRIEEKIKKLQQKRKVNKNGAVSHSGPAYEDRAVALPFHIVVPKKRPIEHLPLADRFANRSPEEELIIDTTLSFIEGLRYSVFTSRSSLPMEKKRALRDWLDLLAISLPSEWGIHSLIDDLRINFERVTSNEKYLDAMLQNHAPVRKNWSRSCKAGFTCGFWKLIHVMTLGVAEHRGGLNLVRSGLQISSKTHFFSPMSAAMALRNYIKHFFPCESCKEHFLLHFDDCNNNRRCDRLTDDIEEASDADWKELAMWAWEVHNDVSVNILNEKAHDERMKAAQNGPGKAPIHSVVEALFPSIEQCIRCFHEDGTWDTGALFVFLEKTYWPDAISSDPRIERMLLLENEADPTYFFTIFLFGVGAYIAIKFRQSLSQPVLSQTLLSAQVMATRATGNKKRTL